MIVIIAPPFKNHLQLIEFVWDSKADQFFYKHDKDTEWLRLMTFFVTCHLPAFWVEFVPVVILVPTPRKHDTYMY